jgi:hypothetical protein
VLWRRVKVRIWREEQSREIVLCLRSSSGDDYRSETRCELPRLRSRLKRSVVWMVKAKGCRGYLGMLLA